MMAPWIIVSSMQHVLIVLSYGIPWILQEGVFLQSSFKQESSLILLIIYQWSEQWSHLHISQIYLIKPLIFADNTWMTQLSTY